ncbi:MAG: hypothetical protein ACFFB3_10825 [Candidatus Hodarchaeota archaeon]
MLFYPESEPVPEILTSEKFLIRPLRPSDVRLDYKAVIANRENLLKRTNGRWPKEGFTIEENLSDLEYHDQQHQERNEFTFTIMNPAESECLGCLYIYPLGKALEREISEEDIASLSIKDYESLVTFWVTPAAIKRSLDEKLLEQLIQWFRDEWSFEKVVLSFGPRASTREMKISEELGLELRYSFDTPKGRLAGWQLK